MNYIVLDLEFNQPYDFNDGKTYSLNSKCPFEIIQIGAVKLNNKFETIQEFNALIRPQIYKRMHPIVAKITNITEETLENEDYFPTVYSKFIQFMGDEENILCIWGPYDIKALYKNIFFYNLKHEKLKPSFINVQSIASKYLKYPSGISIGLKNAVENFDLKLDIPFHNALNDAIYTAHILKKLKKEKMIYTEFNISQLNSVKKANNNQINTKFLYSFVEKELGRKLTQKEKKLYRSVYLLGRKKKFDS